MNKKNILENLYNIKINTMSDLQGGFLNQKTLVECNDKKFVLKIISTEKFNKKHISILVPNVIKLINYLHKKGLKCPMIYTPKGNKEYTIIDNNYHILMNYINGHSKDCASINMQEVNSMAQEIAKMHLLLKNYKMFEKDYKFLQLKNIDNLYEDLNKRLKSKHKSDKYISDISYHKRIIDNIKDSNLLKTLQIQLIHGDLTSDNILFRNNRIAGILDFELVRYNSILQDIGRILLSLALDYNNKLNLQLIDCFVEGYNKFSKLSRFDIIKAFKVVWINEVDLWIKSEYYNHQNTAKVEKFIQEINWITYNWFNLDTILGGKR